MGGKNERARDSTTNSHKKEEKRNRKATYAMAIKAKGVKKVFQLFKNEIKYFNKSRVYIFKYICTANPFYIILLSINNLLLELTSKGF